MLAETHAIARARAIAETGLADEVFPEACPFTADQVLLRAFLPER
jgi:2-methylisocitrate lyase-like PEP mutase family enzyme